MNCPSHPNVLSAPGKVFCQACLVYRKERREGAKKAGMCPCHTDTPAAPGKTVCFFCIWGSVRRSLKKYGLTIEDYARMEYRQNRKCAFDDIHCSKTANLHVDHDHATGAVRELLCAYHNFLIRHPETAVKIVTYLQKHSGV